MFPPAFNFQHPTFLFLFCKVCKVLSQMGKKKLIITETTGKKSKKFGSDDYCKLEYCRMFGKQHTISVVKKATELVKQFFIAKITDCSFQNF